MKVYTEAQVRKKMKAFVDSFGTYTDAAAKIGCTRSELSIAMRGGRIPSRVLDAIGLWKVEVYTNAA